MKRLILILAAGAVLSSCASNAERANGVATPAGWSAPPLAAGEGRADWWRVFGDPTLDALVEDASAHNRDLKAARANLEAARALAGEARVNRLPSGTLDAARQRVRQASAADPFTQGAQGAFPTQKLDDLGVSLAWELDLFGALAASERMAKADAGEALWLERQTQAAVAAAVARAYVDLKSAAQLSAGLSARATALSEIVQRLEQAQALGAIPADRVAETRAALESLRGEIPNLGLAMRNAARRLATLTGRTPEHGLASAPQWAERKLVAPETIAVVDPANTMRRRPDVRAAEARLAGALARIRIAQADLYPRISFLGSAGRTGTQGDLDGPGTIRFTYGPQLSWGVFDLARTRARIAAADATAEAALATWEGVTLAALEEADGALDALNAARAVERAAEAALAASVVASNAARARFAAGTGSALDLARAEMVRLATEAAASQAQADIARAWIEAHLALGAGWRDG
jgi:NodT family efflux transporter outer membrane factor (OMF) lipoprotein